MISEDELLQKLRDFVTDCGDYAAAADKLHVTEDYVYMAATGREKIGPAIFTGLGYRRVNFYEPLPKKEPAW